MLKRLCATLKRVDAGLGKVEAWTLVAILTVMMLVAFAQVVLRNLFSSGLSWGDSLTRALVLWAGFVGASYATRQGRYLSIDAVARILSPGQKRWARAVVYVFAFIVCACLAIAGSRFVRMQYGSSGPLAFGVPDWLIAAIIPVTFALIALRFALKVFYLAAGEELEKQEWER